MGSNFVDYKYGKKLTKEQISKEFKNRQEEGRDYNGHQDGYSGDFQTVNCVTIKDNVFNTLQEALDYIDNNASKWENAVATYYTEKTSSKTSEKVKSQLNKAREDIIILKGSIIQSIKNAKSKTIGCKKCESKINRRYISRPACVVCGGELRSTTDLNRINRAELKVNTLTERYNKSLKSGKVCTVMGAWCAE